MFGQNSRPGIQVELIMTVRGTAGSWIRTLTDINNGIIGHAIITCSMMGMAVKVVCGMALAAITC
jgi:hypothetical protein